jgi:hypothetical protein
MWVYPSYHHRCQEGSLVVIELTAFGVDVVHLDVEVDSAGHTAAAVVGCDIAVVADDEDEDVHNTPVDDMAMFEPQHDRPPNGRGRAIVGESLSLAP